MMQSRNFYNFQHIFSKSYKLINKPKSDMVKLKPIKQEPIKQEPKCKIDYNNMICLNCGYDFCNHPQ